MPVHCSGYSSVKEVDKVVTGNWFRELGGLNCGLVINTQSYLTDIKNLFALINSVLTTFTQVMVKFPVGLITPA